MEINMKKIEETRSGYYMTDKPKKDITPEEMISIRAKDYGPPRENFPAIAMAWAGYLSMSNRRPIIVRPEDVAYMMAVLKLMRLAHSPQHEDSQNDCATYVEIGASLASAYVGREPNDDVD